MTCNTSAVAVCCSRASRCLGHQSRVLHRDHRLSGEVLQQRDLLVGKGPHLGAIDREEAEERAVLAHRYPQHRPRAGAVSQHAADSNAGAERALSRDVGHMDERLALDEA